MSSPDRNSRSPMRALTALAAVLLFAAAGCSVQPLYGETTSATGARVPGMADVLASVAVNEAGGTGDQARVGQQVRNHLIFLLGRGAGQPAAPAYVVDLSVRTVRSGAAQIQPQSGDLEPTAAVVTVRANYTIRNASNRERVASGLRVTTAAFDLSRQEFAALRAERDAQDRAAREVAELLRLSIAQDLTRPMLRPDARIVSAREELEGFTPQDGTARVMGR